MPIVSKPPRRKFKPKSTFKSFLYSLIVVILLIIGYFAHQYFKPERALPKFKAKATDTKEDPYNLKSPPFKLPELKLKKSEQDGEAGIIIPNENEASSSDLAADGSDNDFQDESDFADLVSSMDVFEAIRNGNIAKFSKYFGAQDFDFESVEESTGFNALHLAAYTKNYEILAKIIESKMIDINLKVKEKACSFYEYTALFLVAIAVTDMKKKQGTHDFYNKVEKDPNYSENLLKCAKLLISKGADIKFKTLENYTPLMAAVEGNQPELVHHYISLYNNVNDRASEWKASALDLAMFPCNKSTIDLLIESGTDYNSVNSFNRAAIHEAAARGCWAGVASLISVGVHVDFQTPEKDSAKEMESFYLKKIRIGANPVLYAVLFKHEEMVIKLCRFDADPLMADSKKNSAESISFWYYNENIRNAIKTRIDEIVAFNKRQLGLIY